MNNSTRPKLPTRLEKVLALTKSADQDEARTAAYIFLQEADKAGYEIVKKDASSKAVDEGTIAYLKKQLDVARAVVAVYRDTIESYRKGYDTALRQVQRRGSVIALLIAVLAGTIIHFLSR